MPLRPLPLLALTLSALAAACGAPQAAPATPTPLFVTASLPPGEASSTPPPTQTPLPATALPTAAPIEGSTTSQLNVRSEPSTASASLGMLDAFSRVQVVAKDAGGNWYQVLYAAGPQGMGWVRAQYVQVPSPEDVPPLAGAQSGPSGTVTQQVNVRSGPGTSFNALGTLNPQDSVTLTGKNPEGTWLQIAFSAGEGGLAWIAAGYVQSGATAGLPIIGEQGQVLGTGTPEALAPSPTPTVLPAFEDGDSAAAPAADVRFSPSGSGSLQYTSEVSSPTGDREDWIRFTPYLPEVTIELTCLGSADAIAAIFSDGAPLPDLPDLACGVKQLYHLTPGTAYELRVRLPDAAQSLESTRFTLFISTLR